VKDTERRVIEAAVEWEKGSCRVKLTKPLTQPEQRLLRRAALDLSEHFPYISRLLMGCC